MSLDAVQANISLHHLEIKSSDPKMLAEFYSKDSALDLKERISKELTNFDSKKLFIKVKKSNKTSLIAGPYKSINLMKNDYTLLTDFGFEELDIDTYE